MSCCGQGRAMASGSVATESSWQAGEALARLEYTGDTAILVRGPSSGRPYQFSAQRRVADVQRADAAVMIQTGYFRAV